MHPGPLDSRLGAVCVNLRPVVRVVAGEPLRDVLERIERQDPGAVAAWRRKYGLPASAPRARRRYRDDRDCEGRERSRRRASSGDYIPP